MSTETKWLSTECRQSVDVVDVLSSNLLITGAAGSGKTVAARGLMRAYVERGWLVRYTNLSGHPDAPLHLSYTEHAEGLARGIAMLRSVAARVGERRMALERSVRAYEVAPDFAPLLIVVDEVGTLLGPDLGETVEEAEAREGIVRHLQEFADCDMRLRVRIAVTSQRPEAWAKLTEVHGVRPALSNLALERTLSEDGNGDPSCDGLWSRPRGRTVRVNVPHVRSVSR